MKGVWHMGDSKELQVVVRQTPGSVQWNYEELKAQLTAKMEEKKAVVYTDENIGDAKKELASLRKLRDKVNERKIQIKNACLEPYEAIERQAKELMGLIDGPIEVIKEKTDDFEKRRREKKRDWSFEMMRNEFSGFPKDVVEMLIKRTYSKKWENATTKESEILYSIRDAKTAAEREFEVIKAVDTDIRNAVYQVWIESGNFSLAMGKCEELRRQKEIILQRERQRREMERIRKEEEARRLEEKRQQAEIEKQNVATACAEAQPAHEEGIGIQPAPERGSGGPAQRNTGMTDAKIDVSETDGNYCGQNYPMLYAANHGDDTMAEKASSVSIDGYGKNDSLVHISCDGRVLDKILGYIEYVGAGYELLVHNGVRQK